MGLVLPERSKWAERALQGLAFWMGYRRALFDGYEIPEAALVTESCSLLQTSLPKELVLLCEQQYKKILPPNAPLKILGKLDRADLVIAHNSVRKAKAGAITQHLEIVIEVKRWATKWKLIVDDMQRLHEMIKLANKPLRGWLFVISERELPDAFVTEEGASIGGVHQIEKSEGYYKVRKTCKASHRFKTTEVANYACLIEIFTEKPSKSLGPG